MDRDWPVPPKQSWIGDQKPKYDLLYRPLWKSQPGYYYQPYDPGPYVDTTEVTYQSAYTDFEPHTRWSRMLMEVEEMWECLLGVPVQKYRSLPVMQSYTKTTVTIDETGFYTSSEIIWTSST